MTELVSKFGKDKMKLNRAAQLLFLNFDYDGALELIRAGAGACPVADMAETVGLVEYAHLARSAELEAWKERDQRDPAEWWAERSRLPELLAQGYSEHLLEAELDALGFGLSLTGHVSAMH